MYLSIGIGDQIIRSSSGNIPPIFTFPAQVNTLIFNVICVFFVVLNDWRCAVRLFVLWYWWNCWILSFHNYQLIKAKLSLDRLIYHLINFKKFPEIITFIVFSHNYRNRLWWPRRFEKWTCSRDKIYLW